MESSDNKSTTLESIPSQSCENCAYFFSCKADGDDLHEYCVINPEALGFCELWSGPIVNFSDCHGWTKR